MSRARQQNKEFGDLAIFLELTGKHRVSSRSDFASHIEMPADATACARLRPMKVLKGDIL